MATSRWGRLFGRGSRAGRDDRATDTTPPAYTGIGAPRPYDPPPGAPGPPPPAGPAAPRLADPAPTRVGPPVPGPRPAPSPYEHASTVTRAQYDEAVRRRRAADQQVGVFERFEAKLTEQIHHATEQERHDYVRELLSRRIAVRSRLEEATLRRNRLLEREQELGAGLAPSAGWR
ncbi:hypothetical protein [Actinomycetospora cinnamomea]|uniref:Uncharacterized protein n=1 Tax=Actinomycetospora cinnamomea TaxID=663609 RepID=A0A2U1FDF5_9PSEU|nr:hypothetical protein [Actinomycetospora cinnamomea]PVZ09990.1 hypothetical protein C8D89_10563 [Actinomycetospora cinnamomea]